jgi:hypothetical protein
MDGFVNDDNDAINDFIKACEKIVKYLWEIE